MCHAYFFHSPFQIASVFGLSGGQAYEKFQSNQEDSVVSHGF